MKQPSHLLLRGSSWHFRRRLPGSANSVIQIPLGTIDRDRAAWLAARMSDEIDVMFEHLLVDKDEIPEHLIAQYIDFCMRRTVIYLKQARRESRMSMEAPADIARHDEIRRKVLAFLVEDGLNNILPPHRIEEFPNPGDLKDAMWIHARECKRVATSLKNPNFRYAADRIFGTDRKNEGRIYQINQAYLTARAAVYDDVYPPRPETLNDIEKGSHDVPPGEPDVAQHEQANTNTLLGLPP